MAELFSQTNNYYTLELGDCNNGVANRKSLSTSLGMALAAGVIGLGYFCMMPAQPTSLVALPTMAQKVSTTTARPLPYLEHETATELELSEVVGREQAAWNPTNVAATAAMANLLGPVPDAHADLLTGRTASLVHPAVMFGMLGLSLWAGWLGLQWKRARTIGQEINDVKAEATAMAGRLTKAKLQGTAKETLAALRAAGEAPSSGDLEILNGIVALEQKVEDLQAERKTLTAGNFRDRHFNAGSIVLAAGVGAALIAPANTYLRTGKLFPGPHLYIGAAMVSCWALAAALVPAMQKGNETARSIHVALNAINIGLFIWQVGTGIEIIGKVLEFTSWP